MSLDIIPSPELEQSVATKTPAKKAEVKKAEVKKARPAKAPKAAPKAAKPAEKAKPDAPGPHDFGKPRRQKVRIDALIMDAGTQFRVKVDREAVANYQQGYADGDPMPPIDCFKITDSTDDKFVLVDGAHRISAAVNLAYRELEANVYTGTIKDARLFALRANAIHDKAGLRRTNDDRRNAVLTMLSDAEWKKWSGRRIADHIQVSHTLVNEIKKSVEAGLSGEKPTPKSAKVSATVDPKGLSQSEKKQAESAAEDATNQVPEAGAPATETLAAPELTDEQFLEGCKARKKLTGDKLAAFDEQALFWRQYHGLPSYQTFEKAMKSLIGAKSGLKDLGPLKGAWYAALNKPHPENWKACAGCAGKGCKDCKSDGYVVTGK